MNKLSHRLWLIILALSIALALATLHVAIYVHFKMQDMMIHEFERAQIGAPVPIDRLADRGIEIRYMTGDGRPEHIVAYFQMARPNVKDFDVVEAQYSYMAFYLMVDKQTNLVVEKLPPD